MVSASTPKAAPAAGEPQKSTTIATPQTITTIDQTYLSQEQIRQLLTMVDRFRVQQVQGKSNMAAYDIRAHLNRIFGFGRWDGKVICMDLIYEAEYTMNSGKPGMDVAYKAGYELTVRAPAGNHIATYIEYAVGAQKMGVTNRGDVHDFAMKTAESQALKRAAINLGDQFGLSLYNKGSMGPLVGGTFLVPGRQEPQALVGPTEQLGEEVDPDTIAPAADEPAQQPRQQPPAQQQAPAPQPQVQAPQQTQQPVTHTFAEGTIEAGRADLQQDISKLPPANKNRLQNLWGKTNLPPLYKITSEDQLAEAWGLYGQCLPTAPAQPEPVQAPASLPAQQTPRDDNNFYADQA